MSRSRGSPRDASGVGWLAMSAIAGGSTRPARASRFQTSILPEMAGALLRSAMFVGSLDARNNKSVVFFYGVTACGARRVGLRAWAIRRRAMKIRLLSELSRCERCAARQRSGYLRRIGNASADDGLRSVHLSALGVPGGTSPFRLRAHAADAAPCCERRALRATGSVPRATRKRGTSSSLTTRERTRRATSSTKFCSRTCRLPVAARWSLRHRPER